MVSDRSKKSETIEFHLTSSPSQDKQWYLTPLTSLEHGDESVFNEDILDTAIYCADFFVAAIITRIIDDVGHIGEKHLKSKDG